MKSKRNDFPMKEIDLEEGNVLCESMSSVSGGTGLESEQQYYQLDDNKDKYKRDYLPKPYIQQRRKHRGKGEMGLLIELKDITGHYHQAVKIEKCISQGSATKGKPYYKPRQCARCKDKISRVKCFQSGKVYCYPLKDETQVIHSCFYKHIYELEDCGEDNNADY